MYYCYYWATVYMAAAAGATRLLRQTGFLQTFSSENAEKSPLGHVGRRWQLVSTVVEASLLLYEARRLLSIGQPVFTGALSGRYAGIQG